MDDIELFSKLTKWNENKLYNIYYDRVYCEQLISYAIFNVELESKAFMKNYIPEEKNGYLIFFVFTDDKINEKYLKYKSIKNGFESSIIIEYNSSYDLIFKTIKAISFIKEIENNYSNVLDDMKQNKFEFVNIFNSSNLIDKVFFFNTLMFYAEKIHNVSSYKKFVNIIEISTEFIQRYYFNLANKYIYVVDDYVIIELERVYYPFHKYIYTIYNKKFDGYIFTYKYSFVIVFSHELFNRLNEKYDLNRYFNDLKLYDLDSYKLIIDNGGKFYQFIKNNIRGVKNDECY